MGLHYIIYCMYRIIYTIYTCELGQLSEDECGV